MLVVAASSKKRRGRLRPAQPNPPSFKSIMPVRQNLVVLLLVGCSCVASGAEPIRALLVTGGCCHDYDSQKNIIKDGLEARADIEVTVVQQGGSSTDTRIPLYEDPNWADKFDVVLHDECFAGIKDPAWTQRVLKPHQEGKPAVLIHCAMHCYRDGTDEWFKFCGVTSHGHGAHYGHEVLNRDATHPIMQGFGPGWANPQGELYEIARLWPTAHPLASAKNRSKGNEEVCVWTNDYRGTRVFGTTLGHHNETVSSPEFLDLLTRGTLWACGKLDAGHLKPTTPAQVDDDKLKNIPPGFDATVFATPPAVKYPVFVAAEEDGTLYVAVDQNGSLDRELKRGAVYRLRDIDDDGKADEVKLFVPDVDSPRGMVWDHDRLYVLHPPHLSAFIDHDGDGISDEQKILVKDIAFTFADRPADHTSNGVTMGIDGWLYLAIGDFGFMKAVGSDGRELQFRGGGVVRVRPDGTGLQIYSRGTRNILEVAMDPLLNGFTRDNTNDGGGWDIRLHHFTGLEDHGYPRLYMNFGDEIVQPLADYGGGSGCGALYMDEPGFPDGYGNALYTADWGRQKIFRHTMSPNGSTFAPTQDDFIDLPRVTDLDVDANSTMYLASWQGATFRYVGDEVGYVLRLRPTGYQPQSLPDFETLSAADLVGQLQSPSHRRRLAASRTIVRRDLQPASEALAQLAANRDAVLSHRVAAVFTLKQLSGAGAHAAIGDLCDDPSIQAFAIRALADRWDQASGVDDARLLEGLQAANPRTRLESVVGITRLKRQSLAKDLVPLLQDRDPIVSHTTRQALIELSAGEVCLRKLDQASPAMRSALVKVLQSIHSEYVVSELLRRSTETGEFDLLIALCRLHFVEGEWSGNSWGTRPDTRGPYYQPETWEQSERIAKHLSRSLESVGVQQAGELIRQLGRHRIRLAEMTAWLVNSARSDPQETLPLLLSHLTDEAEVETAVGDFLLNLTGDGAITKDLHQAAVPVLLNLERKTAVAAILGWLEADNDPGVRRAFLRDGNLARNVDSLVKLSAGPNRLDWALTALAAIERSAKGDVKETANDALQDAWLNDRANYLTAIRRARRRDLSDKVLMSLQSSEEKVREIAESIAEDWKLEASPTPAGPQIGDLTEADVLAQAIAHKGDVNRGRVLFEQLQCAKCHTVKKGEALRGPYLPNVAKTYKRPQLAEAVLLPNRSIAQGFVTNVFVLDDGRQIIGFVTNEGDVELTVRDNEGTEMKIPVESIEDRATQKVSVMPEGLLKRITTEDFGSLLTYLESLGK